MFPAVTDYLTFRQAALRGNKKSSSSNQRAVYVAIKEAVIRAIRAGEDHVYYHVEHRFPDDMVRTAISNIKTEMVSRGYSPQEEHD